MAFIWARVAVCVNPANLRRDSRVVPALDSGSGVCVSHRLAICSPTERYPLRTASFAG